MKTPSLYARHCAALPYCYYDKARDRAALSLVTSGGVEKVTLLYGDPHIYAPNGEGPDAPWIWQYAEAALYRQYAGIAESAWKIELALPPWRRLKYAFVIQAGGKKYYYSEKGLFPYMSEYAGEAFNHFFFPYIHAVDAPEVPAWAAETVWYQIFPDRFCRGSPGLPSGGLADWEKDEPAHGNFFGGDLPGICQKLDYLADLGVNGLYLTPVFQAPSNHKYDTGDYFSIDEHFGSLDDMKRLVQESHSRGIRVMLDAVFNHIGETHPFWQDVLTNQEASPYRDYFHIRRFPVRQDNPDHKDLDFETFAFTRRMPKWNTENPEARKYLLDAALYWIRECDIDAWRLDVANEVSFDFWRDFSREVRAAKKDFYILGEIWHDASPWINGGYFSSAMNYPLGFALIDYFLKKTIGPEELTGRLIQALCRYSGLHTQAAFNLLDSHDTARVLTLAGGDKQAVRNAFAMLMLLPGSPCIYYGTEGGLDGGRDPQNRRPMIWDETKQDRDLRDFFKKLIALRKELRGLVRDAGLSFRRLGSAACWELAGPAGTGGVLTVVHAGNKPVPAHRVRPLGRQLLCTAGPDAGGQIPPRALGVFLR
jgi:glycosidase